MAQEDGDMSAAVH